MTISDVLDAPMGFTGGELRRVSLADARLGDGGFVAFDTDRLLGRDSASGDKDSSRDGPSHDDYGRGFAEGYAAAKAETQQTEAQLRALLQAAEAFQPEACEELSLLISETVDQLVTRIFGEQQQNPEWMAKMIEDAVAVISECDEARTLCLHPADAQMLAGTQLPLAVQADAKVQRGSIRIDCAGGWVESGSSTYLQQLRTALGRRESEA